MEHQSKRACGCVSPFDIIQINELWTPQRGICEHHVHIYVHFDGLVRYETIHLGSQRFDENEDTFLHIHSSYTPESTVRAEF